MLEKKKCWCVKKGEKEREKEKKEFFVSVASSLTSSFFLLFVAIGRSVGRTSASSLPSRFFLNSNRKREDSTGRTDVANFDIWKLFFSFSSLLFSFIHYSTHFFPLLFFFNAWRTSFLLSFSLVRGVTAYRITAAVSTTTITFFNTCYLRLMVKD